MFNKITSFQLAALLILARLFSECMNFPGNVAQYSMERIPMILASSAIMMLMTLPSILFTRACNRQGIKESFFSFIAKRNKIAGWLMFVPVCGYLLMIASIVLNKLEFYVSSTVMESAYAASIFIPIIIVVLYFVFTGLQGIARLGPIVLFTLILLMVITPIALWNKLDFSYLYPHFFNSFGDFAEGVSYEMVKNTGLFIYVLLAGNVTDNPNRIPIIVVPAALLMKLLFALLTMVAFGPALNMMSFPLFTIASRTNIVIFERLDGLDMAIWTASAICEITLLFICIEQMLTVLTTAKAGRYTALALAVGAGGFAMYSAYNRHFLLQTRPSPLIFSLMLMLSVVFPLIALIFLKKNKGRLKTA
jgi:hypothetical protein